MNKLGEIKAVSAGNGARTEQSALVKKIGARMREARELNNMSQSVAATRLGYKNSSKLAKIENASDTNSVPLSIIARAASLYDVSIDYLFGVSDDWEAGVRKTQEREVSSWLFDAWEKARRRDVEVLRKLHDRLEAMNGAIAQMVGAAEYGAEAMESFRRINPGFDNERGGARLLSAIGRISDSATAANAKMKRFRVDCKLAAADTSQLSLSLLP